MKKHVCTYIFSILAAMLAMLGTLNTHAQELGTWQVYPSYGRATQCVAVDNYVYALFEGALLRYNTADNSVRTYDTLNGLSDINIVQIAYAADAKRIILVYENGNIDLLDVLGDRSPNRQSIFNISAIKDKTLTGKTISTIYIKGVMAYLATGFGFVAIDTKEGIIVDTYQLEKDVRCVAVTDDAFFLITSSGLLSAPASSNLHLVSSWTAINKSTNLQNAVQFDGELFLRSTNALFKLMPTGLKQVLTLSSPSTILRTISDGSMLCGDAKTLYHFTNAETYESIPVNDLIISDVAQVGRTYWTCEGDLGLKGYSLAEGEMQLLFGSIRPNSPHRNLYRRMYYVQNGDGEWRLLVAGGDNTYYDVYNDPVAMYYESDKWTLLDDSPASTLLPGVKQRNSTDIVQDINDPDRFFVGTWRNGLKEYRNGKLVKIYNSDNSPIRSILPESASYHQYDTAPVVKYDSEGNLWIAQQYVDTIVRYISPDNRWHSIYMQEIAGKYFVNDYLFTTSGVVFMPIFHGLEEAGVHAFSHNGKRATKSRYLTALNNQDGVSYGRLECDAIVEDLTGLVWVGTTIGLFLIEDPTEFFNSDFSFTQVKINRNDGSGFADYLLSGVHIRSLAVDGGNRKWVGTLSNGVYLISADGQELLQHFDTSNSPILSNCVNSIAIHPQTGEVMFGTDKGLCSFMSDATEPTEDLAASDVIAYPNPVTPDQTGSIRIDGLTFNAEVKILSSAGQLVASGTSNGGTFVWDGCNRAGRRVSSGIYHVVSNTESGKKAVVTRIAVVR